MFTVRGVQRLAAVLSPQGHAGARSLAAAAGVLRENGDKFAQMENPYKEPQRACVLCRVQVDYKNVQLLSQFISPHTGRIYGRHLTGLCGRKQREVSKAIKKAHSMGFMSVTQKQPEFMKDPNICSTKRLE